MNFKRILLAACFAALAATQSAQAGTITVTYNGAARLGAGTGVGYLSGTVYPGPNNAASAGVLIGGNTVTIAGATSPLSSPSVLDAWCVDILHWLSSSATATLGGPTQLIATYNDAAHAGFNSLVPAATRVNDLLSLADIAYGGLATRIDSAAFQLAVWAVTYGKKDVNGKYVVSDNGSPLNNTFSIANAAPGSDLQSAQDRANGWLGSLTSAPSGSHLYGMYYLYDDATTPGSTQDLVVFVRGGGLTIQGNPVPEPATLALLGLGLVGVAATRRRRAIQA